MRRVRSRTQSEAVKRQEPNVCSSVSDSNLGSRRHFLLPKVGVIQSRVVTHRLDGGPHIGVIRQAALRPQFFG